MNSQVVTILTLIVAGIFAASAMAAGGDEEVESLVFPSKYKAGSVADGGSIAGTVTFEGDVPEKKKLEITKNAEVCGLTDKFDESVVVGEGNALKNAIVYLMDISSGAAFAKGAKVKYQIDQKGCQFDPHVRLLPVGQRLTMLKPRQDYAQRPYL